MSDEALIQSWLEEHKIEDVEAFVPDMAGVARGKLMPADGFAGCEMKLPEGVFAQTVSGEYVDNKDNVEDRDMVLVPDASTLRPVPWATDPAASVFMDCFRKDGEPVGTSPRRVLRNVLELYDAEGWTPVVAPEVEFYLINPQTNPWEEVEPPEGRLGRTEAALTSHISIDAMNEYDPFINQVYEYLRSSGNSASTRCSQEMGPAQFEINFDAWRCGAAFADQVLLFKRSR